MNKIKPPISDKSTVRAEVKRRVSLLSEEEKNEGSKNICLQLIGLREIQNASRVYAYQSLSDEVCLDTLIKWALAQKKQVFVPNSAKQKGGFGGQTVGAGGKKTGGGNETIASFCPLNAFGTFGDKSTKSDIEVTSSSSVILAPGRAFTLSGKRIGRGGGWYDRFLKEYPNFYTIGVCFDCQIFPELPQDEWDIVVNKVITGKTKS
ncbi:MAG: 5-formyltetrahydrofolate cyclo-ligase [Candidatus Gracilibacteria bacterium]